MGRDRDATAPEAAPLLGQCATVLTALARRQCATVPAPLTALARRQCVCRYGQYGLAGIVYQADLSAALSSLRTLIGEEECRSLALKVSPRDGRRERERREQRDGVFQLGVTKAAFPRP